MAKLSVVVLAGTESHADMGRVTNALSLVKEAKAAASSTSCGTPPASAIA